MAAQHSFFWKKAPFIKLLIGMIAGILVQWQWQVAVLYWLVLLLFSIAVIIIFFFTPFFIRYRFLFISGISVTVMFFSIGAILAWHKDVRNDKSWLGYSYQEKDAVIASLDEPPVEKTKSYKANAIVRFLVHNGKSVPVKGKIILYFRKDTLPADIEYGSIIIFKKTLQEIKNSGNPGGFDYKRYALFQDIAHQAFLKKEEFEILPGKKMNWFRHFIYSSRESVLNILKKSIPGNKERGLAEALLIGYKDDLDQKLVQSYTNTGVVHIIAISGLHLGLIYWLLSMLLMPLKSKFKLPWLRPFLIIAGLWLFSILAGAQPSILRSALMFSCIVLGDAISKKTSIYNTLAISAFILLCINPYWLWDVGFQLSYAAVLSIVIFMRPIYNWFYIKNKILDFIWKLNAVTIAAQILTVPLSIYHFHQFPNYFLLTNFVAVPLSSIILLGEIFLCTVSWISVIASIAGKILSWMIWLMNTWIEKIEMLRFSLWDGLQINITQAILLIVFAAAIGHWLLEKAKRGFIIGLIVLLLFFSLRSLSFINAERQHKIIVYNVPQRRAVDFIDGRTYFFIGDPDLLNDDFIRNFHLKPSRILNRISSNDLPGGLKQNNKYIQFMNKKILLIDSSIGYARTDIKQDIDLLVISKNPTLYLPKLAAVMTINQVVFDGSAPSWKTMYWKKDCDSLHIPWHDVTTMGAFVMKPD
ncbi:MAG: ComEC/Rec2 family competence protein [Chitinophagaceae bacterium]